MLFYPTIAFELTIWFLFFTTALLAVQRHGKIVLLLFGMIVTIALMIEVPATAGSGYDYLDFMLVIVKYPVVLPFGWVVFFYWAHTFVEGLVEWDGTFYRAIILAILTGMLTGTMSLFLEPAGQLTGWWKYYGAGTSGIMFFEVPAEINATYFLWGAFDGLVFRLFMFKGWLARNEFKYPLIVYYTPTVSIMFFTVLLISIISTSPEMIFLFLGNIIIFPVIFILKMLTKYESSFKIKQNFPSQGD